jgi:hypothetical protein
MRSSADSAKAIVDAQSVPTPAAIANSTLRRDIPTILDIRIPFPVLLDEVHNSSVVMYTSLLDMTQAACNIEFQDDGGLS